jgi:ParB family chromosome partitioning protein
MSDRNHVELDWAVDAILVGARHRQDLGDVEGLASSIGEMGLLQPITVTPDGVLICGARRLAAIKQLGWRTVNVWVRTGLSDKLTGLMAERDDVVSVKQYTRVELAAMYAELKAEIAADAARRVQATQFTSDQRNGLSDGIVDSATPVGAPSGDSRVQAAAMLGGPSHFTMERVLAIQHVATSDNYSPALRTLAADALQRIETGAAVDPLFLRLRTRVQVEELNRIAQDPVQPVLVRDTARNGAVLLEGLEAEGKLSPQEMERAAHAALDRVMVAGRGRKPTPIAVPSSVTVTRRKMKTAKHFMWLWGEMAQWPENYDPDTIAVAVPDETWLDFKHTMAASVQFMTTVDQIRATQHFDN